MLLFCPNCNNILVVKQTEANEEYSSGQNAITCRTCPYQYVIDHCYYENRKVNPKKADDIVNESEQWESAQQIEQKCADDTCDGFMAYYYQRQIRSADEPMTTNYKCVKCGKEWREN